MTIMQETVNYEPCPAGTHSAVCVQVIELGMQPGYQGSADKFQIYLAFELPDTIRDDGNPFVLGRRYTHTLNEKGAIYEVIDSLMGKVPKPFNPADLLGRHGLVKVGHKKRDDGRVTAVVESVVNPPASMPKPTASSDLLFYDWQDPDRKVYDQLPEWLRKVVDQGKDPPQSAKKVAGSDVDPNDDIPF